MPTLDTGFLIPNTLRWIPQINTSRFRYDASPFARISNSCEITKNAATRWMTFVKNPSPSPLPRMNPERKTPVADPVAKPEGTQTKDLKAETPKWEPLRKFSPVPPKSDKEAGQKHDELDVTPERVPPKQSPDSSERANRLNQRMKDLYDFKTENEWPKRASTPRPENTWISKSSSEDEKNNHRVRRNSQDLEFNERMSQFKLRDTMIPCKTDEKQEKMKKGTSTKNSDTFADTREARLKKFHEKLRYSEDLGVAKPRLKERRTYSDDYDEKARRASRMIRNDELPDTRSPKDKKRNSDASSRSRDSRGSYAEIEPQKRNSRTSDVSYASVGNYTAKRGSVECKSTRKMFELPPRRAFSQTEERPATPVPPAEFNDDRYVPMKLMSERQKRDSTRYKVYLT